MSDSFIKQAEALPHLRKALRHLNVHDHRIVTSIIDTLYERAELIISDGFRSKYVTDITFRERSLAITSILKVVENYYGYVLNIPDRKWLYGTKWPGGKRISLSNIDDYISKKTLLTRSKRRRALSQGIRLCGSVGFNNLEQHVTETIKTNLLKDVYDQNEEYFDTIFYKQK